jgi:hypothetical protein
VNGVDLEMGRGMIGVREGLSTLIVGPTIETVGLLLRCAF